MTAAWKRREFGWESADGTIFLERGAPMSTGGTNAWMVWVKADLVGGVEVDGRYVGPAAAPWTDPVRRLAHLTGMDRADNASPWFIHRADAGSLTEAKSSALLVLAKHGR
jgi:hypothetical protein